MTTPVPSSFSILAVCTGNICRSPALERLLTAALGPGTGIEVRSAGVQAVVGAPIHAPMAALLEAQGVTASGFAARRLERGMVERADLVVGFTRRHRAAAVTMVPAAVHRSFTLLELARALLQVKPLERHKRIGSGPAQTRNLSELAALAAQHRSYVEPGLDDIEDPFGAADEVYHKVFDEILAAADPLYRALAG